jgi:hypothetical protein
MASMVQYFDLNLQAMMETAVSNYVIRVVLSQHFEEKLYPVVFYSRKMIPVEQNYDIHNKKMLAIIQSMIK